MNKKLSNSVFKNHQSIELPITKGMLQIINDEYICTETSNFRKLKDYKPNNKEYLIITQTNQGDIVIDGENCKKFTDWAMSENGGQEKIEESYKEYCNNKIPLEKHWVLSEQQGERVIAQEAIFQAFEILSYDHEWDWLDIDKEFITHVDEWVRQSFLFDKGYQAMIEGGE